MSARPWSNSFCASVSFFETSAKAGCAERSSASERAQGREPRYRRGSIMVTHAEWGFPLPSRLARRGASRNAPVGGRFQTWIVLETGGFLAVLPDEARACVA